MQALVEEEIDIAVYLGKTSVNYDWESDGHTIEYEALRYRTKDVTHWMPLPYPPKE